MQAVYGAAFITGIVFPKLGKAARVIVPIAASSSFALRTKVAINNYKHDCINNTCSKREKNVRLYSIILNAIATPLTAFASAPVMRSIENAGGWRLFVPFKGWQRKVSIHAATAFVATRFTDWQMHRAKGIDPLTSKNYWLTSADNVLGLLINGLALIAAGGNGFKGKLQAAAAVSITYTLFSIFNQSIVGLINDSDEMIEHHYWNQKWALFHSIPRNFLEWGLFWSIHNTVKSPAIASTITSVYKMLDVFQKSTWYSHAKLKYLEGQGFWKSFRQLPDYRDLFRRHSKDDS